MQMGILSNGSIEYHVIGPIADVHENKGRWKENSRFLVNFICHFAAPQLAQCPADECGPSIQLNYNSICKPFANLCIQ
jgi:hypothetical protein